MNPKQVVLQGRIAPDGTLEVDQKVPLPAGPAEIRVQVTSTQPGGEDTWTVLERIWVERESRGLRARSREEIDMEINAIRDESEQRMREIEQISEEARRHKG